MKKTLAMLLSAVLLFAVPAMGGSKHKLNPEAKAAQKRAKAQAKAQKKAAKKAQKLNRQAATH